MLFQTRQTLVHLQNTIKDIFDSLTLRRQQVYYYDQDTEI